MKIQRPNPASKTNRRKSKPARLSDNAFYLIALALLLKEQKGSARHLLLSHKNILPNQTAA